MNCLTFQKRYIIFPQKAIKAMQAQFPTVLKTGAVFQLDSSICKTSEHCLPQEYSLHCTLCKCAQTSSYFAFLFFKKINKWREKQLPLERKSMQILHKHNHILMKSTGIQSAKLPYVILILCRQLSNQRDSEERTLQGWNQCTTFYLGRSEQTPNTGLHFKARSLELSSWGACIVWEKGAVAWERGIIIMTYSRVDVG